MRIIGPIFAVELDEVMPLPILAGVGATAALLLVGTIWMMLRRRAARKRFVHRKTTRLAPPMNGDPFTLGSHQERRAAPRRHGNPVAVLVSDVDGEVEPVRGWVVDRSAGGLGLELAEEGDVAIGTVLSIRPKDAPASLAWVQVEVRNRQQKGAAWRLGCKFVRPPAWDVLMRFG
ncbi:MAG: PilZ domain-containing protein [Gemmataceae bacterium]|nr:PilZ domain-containing protein [Gemmataceae bacterium]